MISRGTFLLCIVMAVVWVALTISNPLWWRVVAAGLFTGLALVASVLRYRYRS